MKTAIYIEDGITQLVLTPETEYEKNLVKGFAEKLDRVQVFNGTFYDCRGGWVRQTALKHRHFSGIPADEDHSLIMRLAEKPKDAPIPGTTFGMALDAWLVSDDFATCSDSPMMAKVSDRQTLLEKSLQTAFMAGWNARGENDD